MACLTDMCTGTLIVASLHKVSAEGGAEPPQVCFGYILIGTASSVC